ncbi:conjugal transfer protein TraD [Xanthomonas campestris pv. campestris]|uniref:conjugal transfer protein TraD n=1 Tax=Xanthomonas campestris TaxID=339 RepID=UPI0025A3029B|nr:conjugal transfer protein TraD [Xanthomonas campestris]MDM7672843.1 conjugal transfer protein TraD [Xanthomonas campestris pv. campestris]
MTATNHYRDQIQRATERLAQLQAKELLANQRREAKEQETARREEIKQRQRVADLVFLAGVQKLDDAELLGALLLHAKRRHAQEIQVEARMLGAIKIKNPAKSPTTDDAH